ncbi:protocadherin gamma-B1 [Elysia marginata]|uniref:Protocadherin gamma-B1 n=1 Tax=Elysia marginata TaxID=1093978 RepID=A0AAV4H5K0_9GAST|nr:protocadherin gamma-B1 [Elysia marginata]
MRQANSRRDCSRKRLNQGYKVLKIRAEKKEEMFYAVVLSFCADKCIPPDGYEQFADVGENDAHIGKEIFFVNITGDASEVTLIADYNEYFAFNTTTRAVWVNGTIDAETSTTEKLIIQCRNIGSAGFVKITVIISIKDVNDNPPVFTSDVYTIRLGEMTEVGTRLDSTISATDADIGSGVKLLYYSVVPGPYSNSVVNIRPAIAAYDPDRSLNVKVEYSFHDPKGVNGELLAIDRDTAVVTLTNTPTSQEIYLLLQATQTDNPSRYGVALLAVQVQGPNVNAPVFSRDQVQVMRTEAFPVGEVIATAVASDPDPGSIVTYSLDEASKGMFNLDENTGDITLSTGLNYEDKAEHVLTVTASDGALQSTGQVIIRVVRVNKPPVILTSGPDLNVSAPRRTGVMVVDIDVRDDDGGSTGLSYQLLTHSNLFAINNLGQITVTASKDDLELEVYQVAVLVQDNGQPTHSAATAVTVNFPKFEAPVATAQMAESDSLLPLILGAVAAVLLVIVVILTVYICKRRLRDKEHLDRAKKQLPSQDAKALAFKQQGTLGKQARANIEFGEDRSDGDTAIQENPLNSASKGGYYNFGQVSDTDTEVDMTEIQVSNTNHDGYMIVKFMVVTRIK